MPSILEYHPVTEAACLRRQLSFKLLQERLTPDEMRSVIFACLTGSAGYGDADEYSDIDLIVVHENLHRRIGGKSGSRSCELAKQSRGTKQSHRAKPEIEGIQADFLIFTLEEFKESCLQERCMQSHFFPHMYPIFDPRGEFARLQADFDWKEMARHRVRWATDIIKSQRSKAENLWRDGYLLTALKQIQDQCGMAVSLLNGAVGVYPTVKWLSRDFKKACIICNRPEVYEEFLQAFRLDASKEHVQELVTAFFQIDNLWQEVISNHPEVFGDTYQTFVNREGPLFLSGQVRQRVKGKIDRVLRWGTTEDSVMRLGSLHYQIVERWRMYLAQAVKGQTDKISLEDFLSYDLFPERHRILSLQLMRMEKVDFLDFQRIAALTDNLLELSRNTLGFKAS